MRWLVYSGLPMVFVGCFILNFLNITIDESEDLFIWMMACFCGLFVMIMTALWIILWCNSPFVVTPIIANALLSLFGYLIVGDKSCTKQ